MKGHRKLYWNWSIITGGRKYLTKMWGENELCFSQKGWMEKKKAVEELYQSSLCFSLNKSCSFIDSDFQPVFVSIY